MNTRPRAPHPEETKHEVRGAVRMCRPARREGRDAVEPETERENDWNLVRGED
ncbi:hypothetical protein [Streptomyces sp. NPDC016845]|uniref:hypothetical protein n=1 Tax=Streptomyces sp. NPDC016845 TaxID=3364972 RepID=UPI0037B66075